MTEIRHTLNWDGNETDWFRIKDKNRRIDKSKFLSRCIISLNWWYLQSTTDR